MKLWVDDIRPAPEGYVWYVSVNEAIRGIISCDKRKELADRYNQPHNFDVENVELIDTDHDAGDYASDGGNYIELLKWLEKTGRNYPIHIHSDNQINLLWMQEIIKRNGWREV